MVKLFITTSVKQRHIGNYPFFLVTELRNGVTLFSKHDLQKRCEETLKNLGYEISLNKELFSQCLLERFEGFGTQMKRA